MNTNTKANGEKRSKSNINLWLITLYATTLIELVTAYIALKIEFMHTEKHEAIIVIHGITKWSLFCYLLRAQCFEAVSNVGEGGEKNSIRTTAFA